MEHIGVLHPGAMGAAVGAALVDVGRHVCWASDGRGSATRRRAELARLEDRGSVQALVADSDVILSICPPDAAVDVAAQAADTGFSGVYVDANAIAPDTARRVCALVTQAGARFVDGGIVGPPPDAPGSTRLYLSGQDAGGIVKLFDSAHVQAIDLGGEPGAASALKCCYAAYTKGAAALLLAIRALARAEGVEDGLLAEWAISLPELPERSEAAAGRNAPKAWRFTGEMAEIAEVFAGAGLPDGFHRAAADVYQRLAGYRDADPPPHLDDVLTALLRA